AGLCWYVLASSAATFPFLVPIRHATVEALDPPFAVCSSLCFGGILNGDQNFLIQPGLANLVFGEVNVLGMGIISGFRFCVSQRVLRDLILLHDDDELAISGLLGITFRNVLNGGKNLVPETRFTCF